MQEKNEIIFIFLYLAAIGLILSRLPSFLPYIPHSGLRAEISLLAKPSG